MAGYPQTPEFTGLNTPVVEEYSLSNLAVEGTIPPEVEGVFFRATPDPAFPTFIPDDTLLSGDGMISALRISGGTASFDMRYVQTARHKAEVAAGKALFGRYRNPYTDDASVAGMDRTVANTTPVWHAGKLLMTKEDGRAVCT
jgi:carotenoid cleavage dioxygenase-like enzyme